MASESQIYFQLEKQLVPKTQLLALRRQSRTPSVELSLLEDSSIDDDTDGPHLSGRVKRPSRAVASQLSQDRAAAVLAAVSSKAKGISVRKANNQLVVS
jgi:hypothetical protein